MRLDGNLGVRRLLIRGRNTRKLLDLTSSSLLVEALGIALLSHLEGNVDKHLNEGDGLVAAALGLGVQCASRVAVGAVGRDEGGDGDGGGVGEELGDLGDAADVFVAVLFGEAQVLVEAEADVVAVEAVGGQTQMQEVLLKRSGYGGFARGGEAGEPEGEAALGAEGAALGAGEGGVPGNVADFR